MALDLPLTDIAAMLRDALGRYLADNPKPDWQGLAQDLGLMGIGIPETSGGTGGGAIERAVVAEALGPALAGSDWLSHSVAASLLARLAPEHTLLGDLATGEQRIALALGDDPAAFAQVEGGAEADWLLAVTPAGARLVPASACERRTRAMFDTTTTADLTIPAGAGQGLVEGGEAYAWANKAMLSGRSAECAGLMARMHTDTAAYLNQREQFGQPIARFQVLRHRMADMHMALLKASALTERAVLAEDTPGWDHAVSAAAVETIDAVRFVGEGAVQLHGGMGVTEELDLGGQFKRGLTIIAGFGPRTAHLARHAETLA
jgi:alkylation response protein AidB-like acyl-CoA dehydrogenase